MRWEYHSGSGTATCTRGITCDVCGSQYGVLGHDYKLISTRPATCILAPTFISAAVAATLILNPFLHQDTIWKRSCIPKLPAPKKVSTLILWRNNCGYFYTVRIDATGHDWYLNWITDENNHCISAMSATKKRYFEHTWDSVFITIPATCTTPGLKTYTCTDAANEQNKSQRRVMHFA